MKTEKQKMLDGELYNPFDAQLSQERERARLLVKQLNDSAEDQPEQRERVLRTLIPHAGASLWLQPPFFCDYGTNITIGDNVFFNFNCVILDVAPITIGSRVLFAPGVQLYAATHPISAKVRQTGLELGKPITIGDDAWIGGGTIVCPGVNIGARSVIGAGRVVTKDIPADVVAAGNPCRVLRKIED